MLSPSPPPVSKAASFMQRIATALRPPAPRPYQEMGVSGTSVYGGYVQTREKSSAWSGQQRYITIADMAVNASIVAAGVHYFLNLIAHPQWTVVPADDSSEAKAAADLFEEVLHDMAQPWSRVVRRAGTYRFYGFGIQEWIAKKRPDGRVGFEAIEPRPQHTIERWSLSDAGAVEGVFQRSPQTGAEHGIPRSKVFYLVEDALTDSPEGIGIFRHLAESWERLKTYQELEARAFERDLRGIPVGRVPYSLLDAAVKAGDLTEERAKSMISAIENFVQLQVKQSNTSITLDSAPYYSQAADGAKVAGMPQWGLELVQGAATGVEAISAAVTRTQMEMARILAAEHLMMGGEASGNRALSEDKSRNLSLIANAVLSDIAGAAEHDLIPPIWALNGLDDRLRPRLQAEEVAFKDADSVAGTLAKMAQAGAVLAPNDPVIEDVRSLMGVSASLPAPRPEELITEPKPMTDEEIGAALEDEEADDGAEGDIEKINPNHDERGRFAEGPGDGESMDDPDTWPDVRFKEGSVVDLYHVTYADSVESIAENGMTPGVGALDSPFPNHTFFWTNKHQARENATRFRELGGEVAVLKFRVSAKRLNALSPKEDIGIPHRGKRGDVPPAIAIRHNRAFRNFILAVETDAPNKVPRKWRERITNVTKLINDCTEEMALTIKSLDDGAEGDIEKINPNYDERGRFAEGSGGGGTLTASSVGGIAEEITPKVEELMDKFGDETFGLRVLPDDDTSSVGDVLAESHRWEDGERSDDELEGTSTIGVASPAKLSRAVRDVLRGREYGGGYVGRRLALVSGKDRGSGEDPGETIIRDATIRAVFRLPKKVTKTSVPFKLARHSFLEERDLRPLYVWRRLLNGDAIRAWAASQGIALALPAEDMHVTVAFSKTPVDWSTIRPDPRPASVLEAEQREVHQFEARDMLNGALVLRFESEALQERWLYFRDAGAEWAFPEYLPHITITYSVPVADVGAIEPYRGPLVFGPEEFAEVNDGGAGDVEEEPLTKVSAADQPRDEQGQWAAGGGEGGGEAALAELAQGRDTIATSAIFHGENKTGLPHGADGADTIEVNVDIASLAPTQQDIDVAGVRAYLRGKGREAGASALVVDYGGVLLIADGHHRLAADKLSGKKTARVNYARIESADLRNWTATFAPRSKLKVPGKIKKRSIPRRSSTHRAGGV